MGKKAMKYVLISKYLIDPCRESGLDPKKQRTEKREKVNRGDFKAICDNSWVYDEDFVNDMKEALDNAASMPERDAVRNLLEVIQMYVPNWKNLEAYNKSKKYEDDGGAEGKKMLPMSARGSRKSMKPLQCFLPGQMSSRIN